jgi:hypothetical protein
MRPKVSATPLKRQRLQPLGDARGRIAEQDEDDGHSQTRLSRDSWTHLKRGSYPPPWTERRALQCLGKRRRPVS